VAADKVVARAADKVAVKAAVKAAVKVAVKAARGGTVFSSSFLELAGYGYVDKKKQPIYSAVFLFHTREFRDFTREFLAFTREFEPFTREFRPFTRELQFKLLSC
jgi:hypothetical protein